LSPYTFLVAGKIDLSVEVCSDGRYSVAPLELKTGKKRAAGIGYHLGQLFIYTLLMADRYGTLLTKLVSVNVSPTWLLDLGVGIDKGLLYYLGEQMLLSAPCGPEISSLLMRRNELAHYLHTRTMPAPFGRLHVCERCPQLEICMLVHKAAESGTVETSGVGALFDEKTRHVSEGHLRFMAKWDRLIDLELGENGQTRKEIWTLPSAAREKLGRCIGNLMLERREDGVSGYCYRFRKRLAGGGVAVSAQAAPTLSPYSPTPSQAVATTQGLTVGDFVVLSTEDGHYGLAQGYLSVLQLP
jgi:hypothetical protein